MSGKDSTAEKNKAEQAPPSRTSSYTRFKPVRRDTPASGVSVPSTLPPPPFENESDVAGHEQWLESHMNLAANLLCLEQIVDCIPEERAGDAEMIRSYARDLEAVRDALYEMYCDAADPRMAALTSEGSPLTAFIRSLYRGCEAVLESFVILATGLKNGDPQLELVTRSLAEASKLFAFASAERITAEVKALAIDVASPVEPLRNLHKDLEEMFSSAGWLHVNLKKQFCPAE